MIVFIFFLTAWTAARVTRLICEDAILKEPRTALLQWLWFHTKPDDVAPQAWEPSYFWAKMHYLVTCPWCAGLYVSAGAIGLLYAFTDYSIPVPWFWWPGLNMVAVLCLEVTDGAKQIILKQPNKN